MENGFCLYFNLGRWSGFNVRLHGKAIRLSLGYLVICLAAYDLEHTTHLLLKRYVTNNLSAATINKLTHRTK